MGVGVFHAGTVLMWGAVLKLLGLGGGGLAGRLADAYEAKLNAANDKDRIEAEVTIAQLEARRDVLNAGGWVTRLVQAAWAAPFVLFNFKVIVWDKMLGLGVTDPLGEFERNIGMIIVGFYFLTTGAITIVNKAKQ